jgi:hypothetical protein
MAITVTATQGTDTFNGIALAVRVYTGAVEAGGASNTFHVSPGTGPAAVSLTPNASNSMLVFGTTLDTSGTFTAAANNAYDNNSFAPFGVGIGDGHYTGTVTSGTPVTVGSSAPTASDHYNCAAYEIRPSGGSTPALDGSGPAWATTSSAITVTTASFTPPAGSVLVALIESFASGTGSGQTMTVSDTSGLAWTQRAALSYANQSEAVFIFTATVPATGGGGPARPGKTWRRRFRHRQFSPPAPPPSGLTINVPPATADGTSQPQPVAAISPAAGIPAATGTAPQATPAISALAGAAAAAGTAPQPAISISAVPGVPAATGGDPAAAGIAVLAGIPAATGTAPAPAIQTGTVVNAGIPAATGTAPQPVASITVLAGIPAATGTAAAPGISISVLAGLAAATGAAPGPVPAIAVKPGIPVATGAAPAPSLVTGLGVNAPAVTATGTAAPPALAVSIPAGLAAATGAAPATYRGIGVPAVAATGIAAQPAIRLAALPPAAAATATAPAAAASTVVPVTYGTARQGTMTIPSAIAGQAPAAHAQSGTGTAAAAYTPAYEPAYGSGAGHAQAGQAAIPGTRSGQMTLPRAQQGNP